MKPKKLLVALLALIQLIGMSVSAHASATLERTDSVNPYVGQIIEGPFGETERIIQVEEDGSFRAEIIYGNISTYASCSHDLVQVRPGYKIGERLAAKSNICYYEINRATYKCLRCRKLVTIDMDVAKPHHYVSGKCTKCGRSKTK